MQLLKIELPESYEDQIVLTQVEVQKKTMKMYEQSAAVIRARIQVDISEFNRTITGTIASANSRSFLIKQNASVYNLNKIPRRPLQHEMLLTLRARPTTTRKSSWASVKKK